MFSLKNLWTMKHQTIRFITSLLKPALVFSHLKFNKNSKQRIIIIYHGISKKPQFNCVTIELFREQMSWLSERYLVVPLYEFVEDLDYETKGASDLISITFDDGCVNFADLALPILEQHGYHATIFVPSGKIGSYNDWDESKIGFQKMPIMSFEQLRQLPEKMVEIGSHGVSHIALNLLPVDGAAREIIESKMKLEQGVGRQIRFFAFPFGLYPFGHYFNFHRSGKRLLASYRAACTTWWGRYNSPKDLYCLRRIGIWDSDSFGDFADKLQGKYDWVVLKEKIGRLYRSIPRLIEL